MASSLRRQSISESDLALDSLGDDGGGAPNRLELLTIVATRLRNTVSCLVVYIILLVLNSFVLAWELSGSRDHWALIAIESFVNVFLIGEVALSMVTLGRAYWHSKANIADFVITLICIVFFIVFLQEEAPSHANPDAWSYVDTIVIALRYVTQFSRLLLFFFRSRHTREVLKHRHDIDIRLPTIQLDNFEEEFGVDSEIDPETAERTRFVNPVDARNHDHRAAKLPHIRAQKSAIAIGAPTAQIVADDSRSDNDNEASVSQSVSVVSVSESHDLVASNGHHHAEQDFVVEMDGVSHGAVGDGGGDRGVAPAASNGNGVPAASASKERFGTMSRSTDGIHQKDALPDRLARD